MQQHVYCLGYVSFVLVMYALPGLVLYRTRLGKEYIKCKEYMQIVGYINTNALCTLLKFCFKILSTSIEPRFTGIQSILQWSLEMQRTEHRVTQFGFTAVVSKLSNCWTKPYGHMIFLNIL